MRVILLEIAKGRVILVVLARASILEGYGAGLGVFIGEGRAQRHLCCIDWILTQLVRLYGRRRLRHADGQPLQLVVLVPQSLLVPVQYRGHDGRTAVPPRRLQRRLEQLLRFEFPVRRVNYQQLDCSGLELKLT